GGRAVSSGDEGVKSLPVGGGCVCFFVQGNCFLEHVVAAVDSLSTAHHHQSSSSTSTH
ncbi:hypothetical protein KSS87_010042, partial [Heliosperma pusillum]